MVRGKEEFLGKQIDLEHDPFAILSFKGRRVHLFLRGKNPDQHGVPARLGGRLSHTKQSPGMAQSKRSCGSLYHLCSCTGHLM